MKFRTVLTVSVLAFSLAACNSITVSDYADLEPNMMMEEFFNGSLTAHGIVKNRGGKVIRTFSADINAYWDNGVGTLEEEFVFNDGEEQTRIWTLRPNAENGYSGSASDVVGVADVEVAGNSVFLNYVLRIAYGNGTLDLRIDDRMYLVSPNVLINESAMSKFGFSVGQIQLVITKYYLF
jgi:hypothetical protein